jgi:hypothetical protein
MITLFLFEKRGNAGDATWLLDQIIPMS